MIGNRFQRRELPPANIIPPHCLGNLPILDLTSITCYKINFSAINPADINLLMSSDKFKINDIFENAPGVKGPISK